MEAPVIPTRKLRETLDSFLGEYNHHRKQVVEERAKLSALKRDIACIARAQEILQNIAQKTQKIAHKKIAHIVTRCLQTVFEEEECEFRIVFERKRGKTEARLVFVKGGQEVNPLNEDSGGMLHITAFALRLACLILAAPKKRPVIVLDEPFQFVDNVNAERIRGLLTGLAVDLGIQIIMVTHNPKLQAGKVIDLGDRHEES